MQFGVIDIGSNTVVLIIYELENGFPKVIFHTSSHVHLVSYIENHVMKEEGIEKTCNVLKEYKKTLERYQIKEYKAFITEPHRNIDNCKEMLQAFSNCGIEVIALSGKEEAELDYLGSLIDTKFISTGTAFDIGGGSTEFISFKENKIIEAVSIPVGCVRLSKQEVSPLITDKYVEDTLDTYPKLLETKTNTIIGIGGTARASLKLYQNVYHTHESYMDVSKLEYIYNKLVEKDTEMISHMKASIEAGRQEVYLPGLNMLMSIVKGFKANKIQISTGCVREGFLFTYFN